MSSEDPQRTYQALLQRLERFESAVQAQDVSEVRDLMDACQKFLESGQNFDVSSPNTPGAPGSSSHFLPPEQLTYLLERIRAVISATELAQEGIMDEIRRLQSGQRGLKGYRSLKARTQERYINILK